MKKYTPPPKFKSQNVDRGIDTTKPKPQPVSNQFPATQYPEFNNINPDTGQPYVRVWTPD